MRLFPYQEHSNAQILSAIDEGYRRIVDRLATGLGKTTKARKLIEYFLGQSKKVLFVVDLDFVVDDTAAGLRAAGIPCGIIQAGKPSTEASVQVCSLQTIIRRGLRPFLGEPVVFILDECHIFAGPECLALLNAYPDAIHIGLTATPQRGDGTALGNFYELMIQGPQMGWGMKHGVCPTCWREQPIGSCCGEDVRSYLVPRVRIHAPSKQQKDLAWDPVEAWFRFAPGLQTIYFCASKKHATDIAEKFQAAGVGAECVTSDTAAAKRKGFRARVKAYETLVVTTHSVGIKALDLPEIACVGIWRAVSVAGQYLQMIGRGARRAEGKSELILIDGVGNVWDHRPPDVERSYSLEGDPIRVAREQLGSLSTCSACGAVQAHAPVCCRCGAALTEEAVKVSRSNRFVEVKEVPIDGVQKRQLETLIDKGMRFIVPAAKQRQEAKGKRGEKTGRPVGAWLAVEWAVEQFKKKHGVLPLPEVVAELKTALYKKEQNQQAANERGRQQLDVFMR